MTSIKIVAIPTKIAEEVRSTMRAPVYGFPAHSEVGADSAPCRHCLCLIEPEKSSRILFTFDRFSDVESLPQPGPVYIHADNCERYDGDGFPEDLRDSPRTLEAYAHGRRLIATEYVENGKYEAAIEKGFKLEGYNDGLKSAERELGRLKKDRFQDFGEKAVITKVTDLLGAEGDERLANAIKAKDERMLVDAAV